MGQLRWKIVGQYPLCTWPCLLVERQKMNAIILLQLDERRLRSTGQYDMGRDIAVEKLLEGGVIVLIGAHRFVFQRLEDDVRRNLGLTVLEVEIYLLAAQILIRLDVIAGDDLEFGIVQLGDIMNALL